MTTARSPLRVAVAHAAYGVLVHLACLLAVLPWTVRVWRDRRQVGWTRQRFGHLPPGRPSERPVWIHAVSVGEVKAARPLVAALQREHPGLPLVLSTGTLTGFDTARRLYPDLYVFPSPLDLPWVARGVVRRIRPRLLVLLELEVWPALLRAVDEEGVPQVIVNARVSASSFRSYRLLRWWLPEFERLALVAAQDEVHAERIAALGVRRQGLHVVGNLKHDLLSGAPAEAVEALRRALGLRPGTPVLVAGSTHEGEDAPVVRAWQAAGGGAACRLLLVPRHLERLPSIERLLRRLGVPFVRRSAGPAGDDPGRVVLVDSMGELEACFGLADVVFLGGSLVPVGGHNVLEPAVAGRPVLVGPWLETCRREADVLAAAGGLEVVPDERGLAAALAALLGDRERRVQAGRAAAQACRQLSGATARVLRLLREQGLLAGGRSEGPSGSDTLCRPAGAATAPGPTRQGAPSP